MLENSGRKWIFFQRKLWGSWSLDFAGPRTTAVVTNITSKSSKVCKKSEEILENTLVPLIFTWSELYWRCLVGFEKGSVSCKPKNISEREAFGHSEWAKVFHKHCQKLEITFAAGYKSKRWFYWILKLLFMRSWIILRLQLSLKWHLLYFSEETTCNTCSF